MGKAFKRIFMTVAVMIGAAGVVLVTLMIKSHFDSLKPHLTDDYYTDFKSDYELEKKYAGLGSYEVASADYDAGDQKMLTLSDGYMTVWFLYHLQGDEKEGTVFFGDNAEILKNANWQDVQKNR